MDIEKVLTPNWSEECRGIYEAYKAPDVGRINLDSKRVADDVLALLAEREVLLTTLAAFHQRGCTENCIDCDVTGCVWSIVDAIIARARGL